MNNKKRVARNTISLYIRMFVLMGISLFTVRIILNTLGADDYGIYNVVGGIVSMFSFVSGTLVIATQRYFAYYLADNDWNAVNKYFSVNMIIYLIVSGVIFFMAETIGLWLLYNKLVIPEGRMDAAFWTYQISILTFLVGFVISPFQALLVADENLGIYSMISVLEGGGKVLTAYFLKILPRDKLIIYAILILGVSIISNGIYLIYCLFTYKNLEFKGWQGKAAFGEVFSFVNWNLIGAIAFVLKNQGVSILLNMYFGTAVNAARGIAFQISNSVGVFSQNFLKAIDPQIIKANANHKQDSFVRMLFMASKLSFYLLYLVALPLILNMEYVLTLWLKNIPQYTIAFTTLILIDAVVACITEPLGTGVQAIGKMKLYQIVVGGLSLLNLPTVYILLNITDNPIIAFEVGIILSFAMGIARVFVLRKLMYYPVSAYLMKVFLPICGCAVISGFTCSYVCAGASTFRELVINVLFSLVINVTSIYIIGLSPSERRSVLDVLRIRREENES